MATKSLKRKLIDDNRLLTLAKGCPERDGLVVYQARVLYNSINDVFRLFEGNCTSVAGDGENNNDNNDHQRKGIQSVNNPIEATNTIEVYPNPSTNTFNINLSNAGTEQASLKVYDVNGRTILDTNVNANDKAIVELDLNAKNGIYFLVLTDTVNDVVYKQKLVLQK